MNQPSPPANIVTERLLLRPIQIDDTPAMHEIYSDPETMRYWSELAARDKAESRARVQADIDWVAEGKALLWAITMAHSGEVIGKCTLFYFNEQNQRAEIGYVLNRKHWRGGLMSEACTGLIDHAFGALGLHRLEADTDPDNTASIALLERLGFQREGLFRQRWRVGDAWVDSLMFGLLEPDWRAR